MDGVCLIFRFSVFVERVNQQMLGHNVPTLQVQILSCSQGQQQMLKQNFPSPSQGVPLQFSAREELFQNR